tara:strand:+ start:638 stop:1231 length:594 start_codon:yes stop_codon:yes gene_type:complete
MNNKKDSDIVWISIEDKIKKEWKINVQKKKKKIKKSSASKKPLIDFEKDAGKGLKIFGEAVLINVFYEARQVKDYKQLERFIETHAPGMNAADVAVAAAKYAKDNWNLFKLMKDPDYHGAIFELLDAIDKTKGGAVKVWEEYYENKTGPIDTFKKLTSYKVPIRTPQSVKTFQNEMTAFKTYFGLKRKLRKVAKFKD